MDEKLILDHDHTNGSGLSINAQARDSLKTAATWSGFLAILGFVFMALLVIFMLTMGSTMAALGGMSEIPGGGAAFTGIMAFYAILMAVIYFFPLLYLWNFSSKTKAALRSDDTASLNEALRNLARHYKYIGILMIVLLSLYLLMILFALVFAASMF